MEEKLLSEIFAEDIEAVKNLLELGVNVNYTDTKGETPLLVAIETQNYDLVQLLLEHKADPNLPSRIPVLHAAIDTAVEATKNNDKIDEDSTRIIELLLNYGADTKSTDRCGISAYEFAKGYHLPAEKILKDK
jgi:ankyrin repeat protein